MDVGGLLVFGVLVAFGVLLDFGTWVCKFLVTPVVSSISIVRKTLVSKMQQNLHKIQM